MEQLETNRLSTQRRVLAVLAWVSIRVVVAALIVVAAKSVVVGTIL